MELDEYNRRLRKAIENHGYRYVLSTADIARELRDSGRDAQLPKRKRWGHQYATKMDGTNGLTNHQDKVVYVRDDLSFFDQTTTTAHELAHIVLDGTKYLDHGLPDYRDFGAFLRFGPMVLTASSEIQAEGVAYLIGLHFGHANEDWSRKYLGNWLEGASFLGSFNEDEAKQRTAEVAASLVRELEAMS